MILLKVKQGHLETAILILDNFYFFKTFDLIRLSRTVQRTYFIIYEFCLTCFKVEYKRSYTNFSKLFQWNNNLNLDMDFNSEICGS